MAYAVFNPVTQAFDVVERDDETGQVSLVSEGHESVEAAEASFAEVEVEAADVEAEAEVDE